MTGLSSKKGANMGILALILGLLGGGCAVLGVLTGLEILAPIISGGELIGPVVFGTVFWWGLAVILLLATIAAAAGRGAGQLD